MIENVEPSPVEKSKRNKFGLNFISSIFGNPNAQFPATGRELTSSQVDKYQAELKSKVIDIAAEIKAEASAISKEQAKLQAESVSQFLCDYMVYISKVAPKSKDIGIVLYMAKITEKVVNFVAEKAIYANEVKARATALEKSLEFARLEDKKGVFKKVNVAFSEQFRKAHEYIIAETIDSKTAENIASIKQKNEAHYIEAEKTIRESANAMQEVLVEYLGSEEIQKYSNDIDTITNEYFKRIDRIEKSELIKKLSSDAMNASINDVMTIDTEHVPPSRNAAINALVSFYTHILIGGAVMDSRNREVTHNYLLENARIIAINVVQERLTAVKITELIANKEITAEERYESVKQLINKLDEEDQVKLITPSETRKKLMEMGMSKQEAVKYLKYLDTLSEEALSGILMIKVGRELTGPEARAAAPITPAVPTPAGETGEPETGPRYTITTGDIASVEAAPGPTVTRRIDSIGVKYFTRLGLDRNWSRLNPIGKFISKYLLLSNPLGRVFFDNEFRWRVFTVGSENMLANVISGALIGVLYGNILAYANDQMQNELGSYFGTSTYQELASVIFWGSIAQKFVSSTFITNMHPKLFSVDVGAAITGGPTTDKGDKAEQYEVDAISLTNPDTGKPIQIIDAENLERARELVGYVNKDILKAHPDTSLLLSRFNVSAGLNVIIHKQFPDRPWHRTNNPLTIWVGGELDASQKDYNPDKFPNIKKKAGGSPKVIKTRMNRKTWSLKEAWVNHLGGEEYMLTPSMSDDGWFGIVSTLGEANRLSGELAFADISVGDLKYIFYKQLGDTILGAGSYAVPDESKKFTIVGGIQGGGQVALNYLMPAIMMAGIIFGDATGITQEINYLHLFDALVRYPVYFTFATSSFWAMKAFGWSIPKFGVSSFVPQALVSGPPPTAVPQDVNTATNIISDVISNSHYHLPTGYSVSEIARAYTEPQVWGQYSSKLYVDVTSGIPVGDLVTKHLREVAEKLGTVDTNYIKDNIIAYPFTHGDKLHMFVMDKNTNEVICTCKKIW